ncbi:MAG TPA: mechanosensitive ion channel domain-containing protein [Gemmatimonadaceae bacterium]|nr:mechanosensitive ion channel domain-containing protein [Gemmatimonadaceae bacterium]
MPPVPNTDPLDWVFYHNTLRDWLIALAIAAGVFVALLFTRRIVSQRIESAARRRATNGDSSLARSIRHTGLFFLAALALSLGSQSLTFPPKVDRAIVVLTQILVALQIGIWISDLVGYFLHRYSSRRAQFGDVTSPTTLAALGVLARVCLWAILALITLDNLGVHIQTLVAGLGISGIAVALAVQNVLGDAFAAAAIITDKPFVVGDTITVDTFTGTVEYIGLKTTRLRSITGEQIIFSNADLLKSRVRNWKRMNERGVYLVTKVGYETPRAVVATIPAMMREIVQNQPRVRFARSHIRALADTAIEIETLYFVLSGDMDVFMDTQQAIALGTLNRFGDAGVVIATPLHTIVMRPDKNWNAATNSDNGAQAATPSPQVS